jgi:glycosyltransferase involved in cell wall biosynthesis
VKVLQLTYRVPFPPTDGGSIGIYNITKGLHDNGCEIDLVAINTPKHAQPKDCMLPLARQHDIFVNTNISAFKLVSNLLFKSIPYNVERFVSKDVETKLIELLQQNTYDFIQVEGAFVAFYIDVIKEHCSSPVLVRTHNIEYVIWERLALNEKNPVKKWFYKHLGKRLRAFEASYYNKADGIAAITEEDKRRLIELKVKVPIQIVPAGVVLDKYLAAEDREAEANSIFSISALDWLPNLEGLDWFLKAIWPELLKRKPDLHFHIAGKSTPDWLMNSSFPNVHVHGFVDDAIVFKKSYQLMLVPLLSGGGMRVKIIEGLAAKKCIISTTIGAEGIECTNGKDVVIADSPQEWIEAICHYLDHTEERQEIEQNAFKTAKLVYENKAITRKYIGLFENLRDLKDLKDLRDSKI